MENELKKLNVIWDASQLDMFQLCPLRFDIRYNKNKGNGTAEQLERGTLLHNGYEVYYKALKDNQRASIARELCKERIRATSMNTDIDPYEVAKIIDVADENLSHWEFEDQTFEIVAVEEPFIYLLFEDEYMRLYMTGKIDLLVNWHTSGQYYEHLPIDHKSYKRKFPLKKLSNQFQNYAVATNSNLLRVNRVGFQESLEPEEKHTRQFLSYDELILRDWKDNVVKVARQYIDCVAEKSWPQNLTSCDKFNRTCEYQEDVCNRSGQEAKFYGISTLDDVEAWDVTKILDKK